MHGDVGDDTGQDAGKVGFGVLDGAFGGVAMMATRWDKFVLHLVCDEVFHGVGNFVVGDWGSGSLVCVGTTETVHGRHVGLYDSVPSLLLSGLKRIPLLLDVDQDHDVVIAGERTCRKLASLVGKRSRVCRRLL